MSKKVNCPQCKKQIEYDPKNHFRPFCSQRCQIIDLGQWADEGYIIHNPLTDLSEFDEESGNNADLEQYLH